jgi:hypothetical protein
MGNGAFLTDPGVTQFEFQQELQNSLYSRLIPIAWAQNIRNHPVVIYVDDATSNNFLDGVVPGDWYMDQDAVGKPDEIEAAMVQHGNHRLWIMDVHDCDTNG